MKLLILITAAFLSFNARAQYFILDCHSEDSDNKITLKISSLFPGTKTDLISNLTYQDQSGIQHFSERVWVVPNPSFKDMTYQGEDLWVRFDHWPDAYPQTNSRYEATIRHAKIDNYNPIDHLKCLFQP